MAVGLGGVAFEDEAGVWLEIGMGEEKAWQERGDWGRNWT